MGAIKGLGRFDSWDEWRWDENHEIGTNCVGRIWEVRFVSVRVEVLRILGPH